MKSIVLWLIIGFLTSVLVGVIAPDLGAVSHIALSVLIVVTIVVLSRLHVRRF